MRAVSQNSVLVEAVRSATGTSFVCSSFLPNAWEDVSSVSVGWLTLQCSASLLWLGRRGNCAGWCSGSCWHYRYIFKESSDWHLSWKLPTWISMKSWLSNHWRKKGNNQFAIWCWGEDSWPGWKITKGAAFWVWFLFSKELNSKARSGVVTIIHQLSLWEK